MPLTCPCHFGHSCRCLCPAPRLPLPLSHPHSCPLPPSGPPCPCLTLALAIPPPPPPQLLRASRPSSACAIRLQSLLDFHDRHVRPRPDALTITTAQVQRCI